MNGAATFGAQSSPRQFYCAVHKTHNCAQAGADDDRRNTGFLVAVGATLAVCYALMIRLQNRRACGGPSRGGSGGDAGNYTGDNGYTLANWVVTNDHSAIEGSGNPVDAGGFDSGGSFDSAGGSEAGGGDGGSSSD
jgi:hypothetical protein